MLVVNKPFFCVDLIHKFKPFSATVAVHHFESLLSCPAFSALAVTINMYSCVCNLGISKVLYDAAQAELVHILFSRSSDQAARQEPYSLTSANTTLNISRILAIEKL